MKTEYRIYLALAILGILGIAWYMTEKNEEERFAERTQATPDTELPTLALPEADVGAITKIEIDTPPKDGAAEGDKGKVTLVKDGEHWKLTSPVEAAANDKNVEQLLENLKALKVKEVIAKDDATHEQYELTDGKAIHVVAYKGDAKAVDLYFGKSGTRGQMVRVAGTPGVFTADGYSSFLYTREVKNWRETKVASFNAENVVSATIENEHGKLSFSKNDGKWTGSFTGRTEGGALKAKADKDWKDFDPKKVDEMIRAYKDLKAVDFADAKAETGLDEPIENGGVVTFTLKDKGGDVTIKVGKVQKGQNRFAVKEGDPVEVVLSSWSADWATADKAKFEAKPEGAGGGGGEGEDDPHGLPPGLDLGSLTPPDMAPPDVGGGDE
jgi:hypothetical protein